MTSIKIALANILNKNHTFCGVCFEAVPENSIHIQDEFDPSQSGVENTIKVSDILTSVLGEEISNIISTFEYLCKQCLRSAVNCHKFITMAKEKSLALRNSIECLSSCIEETSESLYYYKSLYVTLNPIDLTTQQFYDSESPVTLSSASRRIESLLNGQYAITSPAESNSFVKIEYESPKFLEVNKTRRNRSSSVSIKTSDMLYDKNDLTTLKCKGCQRVYPTLSNLRNHYIRVHAPKIYQCPICNRKYGSLGFLETHKHQSHCVLVCTECGKTFYNRHTLKMHEIGHYKRIVCEDCGRVYKSQTTYKKHIDLNVCGQKTRANPSEAKFTCDYCNKKYTQKVSLRVHIQYDHGNYKAHVCTWCGKKFWAQSRLKAHIVKHTQEKNFGCTICGGKFVTKESLLYHTRTHTGEKPYACHLCDNRFLSASRRADHIKRHHTTASLQCEICHIQFKSQLSFAQHKNVHKEKKCTKELGSIVEEDKTFFDMLEED